MSRVLRTDLNVSCQSQTPGGVPLVTQITRGIGRLAVIAMLGGNMSEPHHQKPEDIKWCDKCHMYYNPKARHGCVDDAVNESRTKLENWLGRYKIVENS